MKTRIVKVSVTSSLLLAAILLTAVLDLASAATHVAATRGTAEPPFLSLGIKSNLLLLLDNSGSMLDMAEVANIGECTDNTFDATKPYSGLFDPNKWYKWTEGVAQWKSGGSYSLDQIVYSEGVFYKSVSPGTVTSSGTEIANDVVNWVVLHQIPLWSQGTVYGSKSFVQFDNQLYYTIAGGTANDAITTDGITIGGDIGVTWTAVDSTWQAGESYALNKIVSYTGMLFRAKGAVAAGTSVWNNTSWERLDEGYFEEIADKDAAVAAFSSVTEGTIYQQDDLYIRIVSVGSVQSRVSAFAASGKMLNWASASKFDIQKKILTGGKYNPDADRLISQHRGCSGRGFVKEVQVNGGFLTFSIKGATTENRIDTTDDTLRIAVLGVSASAFIGSEREQACQDAIDAIVAGDYTLGTTKGDIDTCLEYTGTNNIAATSNPAFNHSVYSCWKKDKTPYDQPSDFGNVSEIINSCEGIYAMVPPATITPEDSGYLCYGVYNPLIPDARELASSTSSSGSDRLGYVGRCWKPGTVPPGCKELPCTYVAGAADTKVDGIYYRCQSDDYQYSCDNYNTGKKECKDPWVLAIQDADPDDSIICNTSQAATPGGWSAANPPGINTIDGCIQVALWDYCDGLNVPEVIDPSSSNLTTENTWGMVGALIDSGIVAMYGSKHALIVMKGYVKKDTQPQGILHSTAGELRIGAMAFNSVGAATECSAANPSDSIVKYCPKDNKDGAQVISKIMLGSTVTDTTNDRTHVDDLVGAINDIRATSWTPLAEAMYNAIGYYTQNTAMRLNDSDFFIDDEVDPEGITDHDPITNWCQSNNILVITEGASTADINEQVKNFITGIAIVDDNDIEIGTCPNGLNGSTYLDDLTNHAQHAMASQLYPAGKSQLQTLDGEWKDKQNITTYVVASGGLQGSVDSNECTPAALISNAAANGGTTYYDSASPEQLENDLLAIFNALRQRASSGSAASVISSSRGGEGAIYQAIFWPEIKRADAEGKEHSVTWTGDVHALFVDSHGFMYEDTPAAPAIVGDRAMTSADKRVMIYFDEVSGKTKGCYNTENWLGTCPDTPVDIQDVKYIWSAGEWLSGLLATDTSVNRTYLSSDKKRYIYTWNDLNNDGIVNRPQEWLPFEARSDWHSLAGTGRSSVPVDFDVVTADVALNTTAQNAKVNDIVNWVRGRDRLTSVELNGIVGTDDGEAPLRSRQLPAVEGVSTMVTARLGDIIHSTPMTVSSPAEGFHLIYNDFSYAEFVKKYKQRRHVVYFGSNDGMLHAVNGGFYDENDKKFCLTVDCQGEDGNVPALGAELWAYVPYNLLPHLSSLTNPDYGDPKLKNHKYFVDLRPRIFDVQIFPDDATHPRGWGTILVGGMRLGGAPIDASELNNASPDDIRQFISSYFIFDITDPEQPPVLLGEMTRRQGAEDTDLGHSLAIPTMVIMKKGDAATQTADNQWYLVFGSGPHAEIGSNNAMKGISDQNARLAVLPLDWLVKTPTALRIPAVPPTSTVGGTIVLDNSLKGFTSDLITIDGDINPTSTSYMADAVYFGTNEGNYTDGFGGRIYRLMTRNKEGGSYLFGNTITQQITTPAPDQWLISTLMNIGQPVNAAPSVGYDGHNFWLYVGTGRFFHGDDRTDATQQSFYGIKEPMEPVSGNPYMKFLGGEVVAPAAHGDTSAARSWPSEIAALGNKGLLKVDEIRVAQANTPSLAALSCRGSNTLDCIPSSMKSQSKTTLADLTSYIAGPDPATGDPNNLYNSTDGWYIDYFPYGNRERNLGQATLFGGLVTFTSYQPFLDPCQAEGKAFLYTLYYQTGTAWHEAIFGGVYGLYDDDTTVREKMDLGRGLSTTPNLHVSGDGDSVTAMVQTSTGVIVEQKMDEMATDNYFTGRTGWKECTE